MTVMTNVYGRVLPIDRQLEAPSSGCVDCGHPHWDRLRHLYVRCGMCGCENVGRNETAWVNLGVECEWGPDGENTYRHCDNRDIVDEIDQLVDEQMAGGEPQTGFSYGDPTYPRCGHCDRHWHGLPITERIAAMYHRGRYDETYSAAEDTTRILCHGSDFIGPMPHEQYGPGGAIWGGQQRHQYVEAFIGQRGEPGHAAPEWARRAVEIAERLGLSLNPWQRNILSHGLPLHTQQRGWWRLQLPSGATVSETGDRIQVCFGDPTVMLSFPSEDTWIDESATPRTLDVLAVGQPTTIGGTWEPLTTPGVETHPADASRRLFGAGIQVGQRISVRMPNGRLVTGNIQSVSPWNSRHGQAFTVIPDGDDTAPETPPNWLFDGPGWRELVRELPAASEPEHASEHVR